MTLNPMQPIVLNELIGIAMALCEQPLNDQEYIYKVITAKTEKIVIKGIKMARIQAHC